MMGPNWQLADDRKTVTVSFPSDPPVALKLDCQGVDELLHNLAEFRADMRPQHLMDFALGQKVVAATDPCWLTEPEIMTGASLIHLRHPGFGWLSFLFPRDEAAKLGEFLQTQAAASPAPSPDKPH